MYVHVNKINGKKYVGITSQKPEQRWGKDGNGYKRCKLMARAINKYGWNNFEHLIVCCLLTKKEAISYETILIKALGTQNPEHGYNCTSGGEGVNGLISSRRVDLAGKKIHRLTVQCIDHAKDKKIYWKCKCDCGNTVIVSYSDLAYGNTKSCGCLNYDRIKSRKPNKFEEYDDNTIVGYTHKGISFYFDKEYLEKVKNYTWRFSDKNRIICDSNDENGRIKIRLDYFLLGIDQECKNIKKLYVDYFDGDYTNLRMNNISLHIPNEVPENDYIRFIAYNRRNINWIPSAQKWRVFYNKNKSKSFLTFDDALEFEDLLILESGTTDSFLLKENEMEEIA